MSPARPRGYFDQLYCEVWCESSIIYESLYSDIFHTIFKLHVMISISVCISWSLIGRVTVLPFLLNFDLNFSTFENQVFSYRRKPSSGWTNHMPYVQLWTFLFHLFIPSSQVSILILPFSKQIQLLIFHFGHVAFYSARENLKQWYSFFQALRVDAEIRCCCSCYRFMAVTNSHCYFHFVFQIW